MKKRFPLFVLLLILLMAQSAFAETKLTQPVVDLINSKKFLIKFELKSELDGFRGDQESQRQIKNSDLRNEYTLVFDGQNALTITDSYVSKPWKMHTNSAMLFNNGESYMILTMKGVAYNSAAEPITKNINQINHFIGANKNQGRMSFESAYKQMIFYFLPLFPELNTITDLQGNTLQLNHCTVFTRNGEANYGGQKYEFEEYRTPDDSIATTITRFYFKEGKLVKVVAVGTRKDVEADEDWKNAFGTEKIKLGSLTVMDIYEITDSFNPLCLQVPQGIKVVDIESPF